MRDLLRPVLTAAPLVFLSVGIPPANNPPSCGACGADGAAGAFTPPPPPPIGGGRAIPAGAPPPEGLESTKPRDILVLFRTTLLTFNLPLTDDRPRSIISCGFLEFSAFLDLIQ